MRILITVQGDDTGGVDHLRRWLSDEPDLRGRVHREAGAVPPSGAMGSVADALVALLEPGGVAAVFAGAVVAWTQSRRGDQTITITRADGTEITISSTQVKGLDARQTAELAERLAAAFDPAAETGRPPDRLPPSP
jgi:hypothetical protein